MMSDCLCSHLINALLSPYALYMDQGHLATRVQGASLGEMDIAYFTF